jgi:hypothetical protein
MTDLKLIITLCKSNKKLDKRRLKGKGVWVFSKKEAQFAQHFYVLPLAYSQKTCTFASQFR